MCATLANIIERTMERSHQRNYAHLTREERLGNVITRRKKITVPKNLPLHLLKLEMFDKIWEIFTASLVIIECFF